MIYPEIACKKVFPNFWGVFSSQNNPTLRLKHTELVTLFKLNGFEDSGIQKMINEKEANGALLYADDRTIQNFFNFTKAEMKRFNEVRLKIDLYPNKVMLPSFFQTYLKKTMMLSQMKNLKKSSSQRQNKKSMI